LALTARLVADDICHSEGAIMSKTRVAQCACGGVSATIDCDPEFVVLCSCTQCQKRTGSPFGIGAYFLRSAVTLSGVTNTFVRKVEGTGRTVTNHFCPDCGGTVYWTLDLRPLHIGIATGHFADADFPAPTRAVWTQHKHEWVALPPGIPAYPQAVR
jgi:hypothetical protein